MAQVRLPIALRISHPMVVFPSLGAQMRYQFVGIGFLLSSFAWGGSPQFTLTPKKVGQGQAALVQVRDTGENMALRAGAQAIETWDCGTAITPVLCGIVSVPLDTKVGKMDITAEWTGGSEALVLPVRKGKFHVNKLKVKPAITQPSDEEKKQIAQDKADIETAYKTPEKGALWEGVFELPTPGAVTSQFGNQRTYNGELKSTHFGVDLRADTTTPIHATNTGKVLLAHLFFMAGNMVLLDHGHGIYSSYAHLSEIKVKPGDVVKKGDVLGIAGATGRVTGPHLHWGMRANGVPVDPHSLRTAMNLALEKKPPLGEITLSKRGKRKN
jgi:biotin carboxyl carrier protein